MKTLNIVRELALYLIFLLCFNNALSIEIASSNTFNTVFDSLNENLSLLENKLQRRRRGDDSALLISNFSKGESDNKKEGSSNDCYIPYCQQTDSKCEYCIKCNQGFNTLFQLTKTIKKADLCYKIIDNCKEYNEYGVCSSCKENLSLVKIEKDVSCQPCQKTEKFNKSNENDNSQVCTLCDSSKDLFLYKGKCIKNPNCSSFDENTGYCTTCKSNYKLEASENKCYQLIEGCPANLQIKDKCIKCKSDYININNLCYKKVENCVYHSLLKVDSLVKEAYRKNSYRKQNEGVVASEKLFCDICEIGFLPDLLGGCKKSNCKTREKGFCTECFEGYKLSKNSDFCFKVDENCEKDSEGLCEKCKTGFSLRNFVCQPTGCKVFLKKDSQSEQENKENKENKENQSSSVSSNLIKRISDENTYGKKIITNPCKECYDDFILDLGTGQCFKKEIDYSLEEESARKNSKGFILLRKSVQNNEVVENEKSKKLQNYSFITEKQYSDIINPQNALEKVEEKKEIKEEESADSKEDKLSKLEKALNSLPTNATERNGIRNCLSISNKKCIKCQKGFRVKDGLCLIENCSIMEDRRISLIKLTGKSKYTSSKCLSCEKGFYLSESKESCLRCANILFEKSTQIPKECAICPISHRISSRFSNRHPPENKREETEETENILNIKENEETEVEEHSPPTCSEIITNCIKYNNRDLCDECDLGYLLSKDKKLCFNVNRIYDNTCYYMNGNILYKYYLINNMICSPTQEIKSEEEIL